MRHLARFFRRHLVVSFAAIALAVTAGLLVGVSVARASSSDCPDANWCAWPDYNYSGVVQEYNNAQNGTGKWNHIQPTIGVSSVLNNRANKVYFADVLDSQGQPVHKDCMIPGGGRGNLLNYYYPNSNANEDDMVFYYDLIYSGTTC